MTPGPTPSTDLRVRPASRSTPAGDAAIKDLRRRLVRLAVKLIWNRQDAEEIVQDAFQLAMTTGTRFPDERRDPWMLRTVANLCLNRRRRRRPEPLADWTDLPAPASSDGASPSSRLQRAEQLDRLREAIAELPNQQRIALVLRTMERMDYLDIAEVMALSVPAVRSHVHFARRRLADLLGAGAGGDLP
ncbi:MAG: RNA polymerase sigma factor [Phycisphaerae bacterium]|nr:RNA polymerase sigma factor [Phycisphaerae bacterium]